MPKVKQLVSLDQDSLDILKDIPNGKKSEYIRESIKNNFNSKKENEISTEKNPNSEVIIEEID